MKEWVEKDQTKCNQWILCTYFSDGCFGQNRNHAMVRMLSCLVTTKMFKDIKQYFPIRGHSFLPCDRDFAVLKRKLRRWTEYSQ